MNVVPLRRPSGRGPSVSVGDIVAALDVGSTKITCLIGEVKPAAGKAGKEPEIKIIGVGHQAARGVRGGVVINLDEAERAIRLAVNQAERMAKTEIYDVLVNVSGGRPNCQTHSASVSISDDLVSQQDIDLAIIHAAQNIDAGRRIVLHATPVQFHVDDARGIADPMGMFGEKLSVDMNVVLVEPGAMRNLALVIERCHLNVAGLVIAPYAAGRGVLVDDEKILGTVLIEMGGATTSVAAFNNGHLCFAETVPVGGEHITRDLAAGLSTTIVHAERLKTLYGNALGAVFEDRDMVAVPLLGERGVDKVNYVPRSALSNIIRPRLEEIFELVHARVSQSALARASVQRVVLTGGASQLPGVRETAGHIFQRDVRLGHNLQVQELPDVAQNPSFALAAGLLRYAVRPDQRNVALEQGIGQGLHDHSYFRRMGRWIKESF